MNLSPLICGHSFCHGCILQWHVRKQSCPLCKKPTLMSIENKSYENVEQISIVDLSQGTLGITVYQNKSGHLCVKDVKQNGQFYKHGFKKGSIIKEMNGLIYNYESFIKAVEFAHVQKQAVHILIPEKQKPKIRGAWKRVFETIKENIFFKKNVY